MKVYQSPLFISSLILFGYGCYLMTNIGSGPMGFGALLGAPLILIALTGIIVHLLFKKIIGNNFRIHFLIELALLLSVVFIKFIR